MTTKPTPASAPREPFHRVHRNFFVGLFILVPLIAIPCFLVYTFSKSEIFQKWLILHVSYDNAYGVNEGSAVTISGVKVGYVKKVAITPAGLIVVSLRVQQKYNPLIRKNSHALLQQKNLAVGDWEIILTRGDSTAAPAADGDTLAPELPLKIDEVIKQVLAMVRTVDTIVQGVAHGEGLVGAVFRDSGMVKKVDGILNGVDKTVRNANNTVANLDRTLASIETLTRAFVGTSDSLNAVVTKIGPIMEDTRKLIASLDNVSNQAPETMNKVNKDLNEVQILLRGLQEHWLFKKAVKKAKEKDPELSK